MRLEVTTQIFLLLDHGLEQESLLRREVAVEGSERDIGRGRDVAHLHGVEPARRGQLERGVEHAPPPRRLAARERRRRNLRFRRS